jgi:hypothetical protein
MGIASASVRANSSTDPESEHHHEHHSFSNHTKLPPETILLSSFVDLQGGSNSSGMTETGVPLVHYISLDHESKAVVLTCRGTLGFEDVLTDMTCEYDELTWRGRQYMVHKGIHASARRLLEGRGGRVLATIMAALEEFQDYGLIMCGHSLGGGVASLLAVMISEPDTIENSGSAFVTTSTVPSSQLLITSSTDVASSTPSQCLRLPSGRPIHVYAYGPPATMSPSLRKATRGLITTVVNGQDVVPFLSLGVLHDLQGVALAFKTDTSGAKGEVRNRVWEGLIHGLKDRFYGDQGGFSHEENDQWALSALKSLRVSMLSAKLTPPGDVFVIETQPVLQRDAFTRNDHSSGNGYAKLGRPATRAILKYIRDVERRFGEIRFGRSMLADHNPRRYEMSIAVLGKAVLDEEI